MVKRFDSYLAACTVAVLALTSCHSEIDLPTSNSASDHGQPTEMTFYGVNPFGTKTVLNDEAVLWESDDEVKVLWGENKSYDAAVKPYDSNMYAEFTAEVDEASEYYGVYPSSAESSLSDGKISLTVPQIQSGVFADASITVAKADSERVMRFRHAVSYLEFSIDKPGQLTISGGNPLAGTVTVNGFNGTGITDFNVTEESASIIVDIKASGTYHIAVLPNAHFDYVLLTLQDGEKSLSARSYNPIQMNAGKLVSLGNITSRLKDDNQIGATLESFTIVDFNFESPELQF